MLDSLDGLIGGSAPRRDRCRLVVKHATGIRSKELVHRDSDPISLFSFLSNRVKKRILNRGGRSLDHRNEQASGRQLRLCLLTKPNLEEINRLFRCFLSYKPSVDARKNIVSFAFSIFDFRKKEPTDLIVRQAFFCCGIRAEIGRASCRERV